MLGSILRSCKAPRNDLRGFVLVVADVVVGKPALETAA